MNFKKPIIVGAIVVAVLATSVTAFAATTHKKPAEIVAGLAGRTVDSIVSEKTDTGKTYGTIAKEAGKLDEFKQQQLENKKQILQEKVAAGTMTQEKADEIIKAIEERQENCDGTAAGGVGKALGAGFGEKNGTCNGTCDGQENGQAQYQHKGRGIM